MKRTRMIVAALMLVVSTAAPAQKYYDHEVSAETVAWDLRDMMERFTRYIEMVGTTQILSNGVYTPNRKVNAIIKDSVPSLFYDYKNVKMITTQGVGGKVMKQQPMNDYFRRLEIQSRSEFYKVEYSLEFDLLASGTELKWKEEKDPAKINRYGNGAKLSYAEVTIYQEYRRYKRIRGRGNETELDKVEEDRKTMKVYKIEIYNQTIISLGDVTKAERYHTEQY